MAYNNDYFLEEIRQRADIVDVISSYVKLKHQGKNFLGLCPFHQEKTPSFNVNREKQLYYCFGCGAGGDIFNFLMEVENLPFMEAAKLLAERYGVPIPDQPMTKARRKSEELREQLFEIHEWAGKFYHYLLLEHNQGKAAREYFEKRGFTRATIEKFRLGSAPQGWTALFHFLKKKGYSDGLLEKSGLVLPGKKGYYDRFRERAIFTIFNLRGQPIGFGGRVMKPDQQPKYLNSPETLLFEKNQNLYGLNFAKDAIRLSKQAIMVEGYTDVITAHQYGVENVIASLGTALTENQARLLARYAEEVYIAYDADTAGQNATLRGLDILKEAGLIVKVIKLPDDSDPDELIREEGKEKFLDLLNNAISLVDFKLRQILEQHDLNNPDGKVKAVQELLPLFLNIDNAIEKDYLIGQIVEGVQISRQAIEEELKQFIQEKSQIKDRINKKWHTREENKQSRQVSKSKSQRDEFERKFIHGLLRMPKLLGMVFSKIKPEVFQNSVNRVIMEVLYNYYQREDQSDLATLTTNQLLEIFPQEDYLNKQVMEMFFHYQELEITENFVVEGLKNLKGYQKAMEMETLRKEINHIKTHGNLTDLNQMLIRYHRLLHQESRKEGC